MSHDQKPARMRVVSSGGSTAGRRRGDEPTIIEHGAPAGAPGSALINEAVPAQSSPRGSSLLLSVIFILGCAAGAIGLTLSGVI